MCPVFTLKTNFDRTLHVNIRSGTQIITTICKASFNDILNVKTLTYGVFLISQKIVLLKCASRGMILSETLKCPKLTKISKGQTWVL